MDSVVRRYDKDPFAVHARHENGAVADTIHSTAHDEAADLIVMSTHGHTGWRRMVMGSVATELIPKTSKPILLVRPNSAKERPKLHKILVTLDGSALAERVLPYVQGVAKQFESEVVLLNVPQGATDESSSLETETYLQGVAEVLANAGIPTHTLITGADPIPTILEVSQNESVDLIMLATNGRGGIKRLLIGSVADAIMRQAHCPVFIIPADIGS